MRALAVGAAPPPRCDEMAQRLSLPHAALALDLALDLAVDLAVDFWPSSCDLLLRSTLHPPKKKRAIPPKFVKKKAPPKMCYKNEKILESILPVPPNTKSARRQEAARHRRFCFFFFGHLFFLPELVGLTAGEAAKKCSNLTADAEKSRLECDARQERCGQPLHSTHTLAFFFFLLRTPPPCTLDAHQTTPLKQPQHSRSHLILLRTSALSHLCCLSDSVLPGNAHPAFHSTTALASPIAMVQLR